MARRSGRASCSRAVWGRFAGAPMKTQSIGTVGAQEVPAVRGTGGLEFALVGDAAVAREGENAVKEALAGAEGVAQGNDDAPHRSGCLWCAR